VTTVNGGSIPVSQVTAATLTIPAANYTLQSVLMAGYTVDVNGYESPEGNAPIREDFIYGADGNRVMQIAESARTVYVGLGGTGKSIYERTTTLTTNGTTTDSAVQHVHFIYAGGAHGGNAFAMRVVADDGSGSDPDVAMKYSHFDHLGSVNAMSDETGKVIGQTYGGPNATALGYDAWGARRNPDGTGANPASFNLQVGHREYTGHEAIPNVGLVNMNGRVYDPELGRFLSPDPNVQFVANLQSYNRYSYVLNNPIRYTDPTGYLMGFWGDLYMGLWFTAGGLACAATYGAGCVAFAIAGAAYATTSAIMAGEDPTLAIGTGVMSAALGFAGGAAGTAAGGQMGAILGGAISGAVISGMTTAMVGGRNLGENMMIGFFSGAIGAAISVGIQGETPVSQASADGQQGGGDEWTVNKRGDGLVVTDAEGRPTRYIEDPQAEINASLKKWGFPMRDGLTVQYDPDLENVAQTTGDRLIRVGPAAFRSEGYLASTLDHEFVHVDQYVNYRAAKLDTQGYNLNEVEAYNSELSHAGKYGLSVDEVSGIRVNRDFYYNQLGTWDRMGTWFGQYGPSSADLYRQRPRRRIRRRRSRELQLAKPSRIREFCRGVTVGMALRQSRALLLYVLIVLATSTIACCKQSSAGPNVVRTAETPSASLAIVQPSEALRADSSKVDVVLRNEGHSSFWVNKRGFSGYHGKPSPLRELSLEAWDSSGSPVEFYCFDKSEMARKADYVLLEAGADLHFKVGLSCFKFKGPGTYSIVAHYQDSNNNPTTIPGSPVLVGEVTSAPAKIQLAN